MDEETYNAEQEKNATLEHHRGIAFNICLMKQDGKVTYKAFLNEGFEKMVKEIGGLADSACPRYFDSMICDNENLSAHRWIVDSFFRKEIDMYLKRLEVEDKERFERLVGAVRSLML